MYHTIVISGGASYVAAFFGCIRYLEHTCLLGSVRRFVGSSAGSFVALLLTLGLTADEIRDWTHHVVVGYKMNKIDTDGILDIVNTMGLDPGDKLLAGVRATLRRWCSKGENATFADVCKLTGHDLVICALNVNKQKHEYFSLDKTPLMPVALAVRISMSIPLLWQPVHYNDSLYVDPLIGRNFPFDFPGACVDDPGILGLTVKKDNCPIASSGSMDFYLFLLHLLGMLVQQSNDHSGKFKYTMVNVKLDNNCYEVFSSSTLEFIWSTEHAISMSQMGYMQTEKVIAPLILPNIT